MVQAFRGVGKSWITAAYAVWILYCDPTLNVVVVSAANDRAEQFTAFCLRLVKEMEILQHLIPTGDLRDSVQGFDVAGCGASQTPSMCCRGLFGQLTGLRADVLIPDDIEVSNNSETVTMRLKIKNRIPEFDALLKPNGKVRYLGTPQTEDTVYQVLPERGYAIRIWPILYMASVELGRYNGRVATELTRAVEKNGRLAGQSTEPTRFTMRDIEARRLSWGRAGFALQFLLDPSLSDLDKYPFRCADLMVFSLDPKMGPDRVLWSGDIADAVPDLKCVGMGSDRWQQAKTPTGTPTYMPYETVYMAIDPAGRGKDETAYAVIASLNGTLFLLDAGGMKGYEEPTQIRLAEVAKRFGVHRVFIEPNMGDGMFLTIAKPVFARVYPCTLVESERSSGQKERRICDTLEPVIAGHRLVIDLALVQRDYDSTLQYGDDQRVQYRFAFQLTHITRDKGCLKFDDRLDAVALCVREFQRVVQQDQTTASAEAHAKIQDDVLRGFLKHALNMTSPAKPNFAVSEWEN